MKKIAQWTWYFLRLAVLVFLIAGVVDIFLVAGSVFRWLQPNLSTATLSEPMAENLREPPQPYTPPASSISESYLSDYINYKRLHIDIDSNRVAATYDVYLKKNHPLFIRAETNTHPLSAQVITNGILGAVSVSNQLLNFERVETAIAETDERGHFYVTAAHYRPAGTGYTVRVHAKQRNLVLNIASTEVIVHTRGVNVHSALPDIPVSKTQEETRYILPAGKDEMSFVVEVNDYVAPANPQSPDPLAVLLQKDISLPGLNGLLLGLLEAIPFLILLVWCRRNACAIPDAHSQQRVIETYLVFHFSYFFFYAMSTLIENWRSPFMLALSYFEQRTLPAFEATNYINETYVLWPLMALFIYGWPKLAHTWTQPAIQITPRETDHRITKTLKFVYPIIRKIVQALTVLVFLSLIVVVAWLVITRWDTMRTNLAHLTVAEFYSLFLAH